MTRLVKGGPSTDARFAKRCLVTGAAGFIGSALVRLLLRETEARVLAVDKLTYAGVPASLREVGLDPATCASSNPRLAFLRADVCDREAMEGAFAAFEPDVVFHLAAETHVDRSIDGPEAFVQTNVVGTATLLQASLAWWRRHPGFVFLHVSTDEVYGALGARGAFAETAPYAPRSPYAASKAGADHLVRAWHETYGLPVRITNCTNNYGPYQFPEKLIPRTILAALDGRPLPVYGTGANVRDWLFVDDHARALLLVCERGADGARYNVGGRCERTNLEVVRAVCALLDARRPRADGARHAARIAFVPDRPGHDFRYAVDPSKLTAALGWRPCVGFEAGLRETVAWYLDNEWWWRPLVRRVAAP